MRCLPLTISTIVVLVQLQCNMYECGCVRTRGCICARSRVRLMLFTCSAFFRHLFSVQSNENYVSALATNGGGRAKLSYKLHLLTLNASSVRVRLWPQLLRSGTMQTSASDRAAHPNDTQRCLLGYNRARSARVPVHGPDNSGHKSVLPDPKMTSISYLIRNDIQFFWCSVVVVKID